MSWWMLKVVADVAAYAPVPCDAGVPCAGQGNPIVLTTEEMLEILASSM